MSLFKGLESWSHTTLVTLPASHPICKPMSVINKKKWCHSTCPDSIWTWKAQVTQVKFNSQIKSEFTYLHGKQLGQYWFCALHWMSLASYIHPGFFKKEQDSCTTNVLSRSGMIYLASLHTLSQHSSQTCSTHFCMKSAWTISFSYHQPWPWIYRHQLWFLSLLWAVPPSPPSPPS